MEKIWAVTATEDDCVELTLTAGPPRPLVAAITGAELRSLVEPLRPVDEAVRRNEFDRAQLAAICRDTIGRDPFVAENRYRAWLARSGWGFELALVAGGLVTATGHSAWWQRLLAGAVAAYGVCALARRKRSDSR